MKVVLTTRLSGGEIEAAIARAKELGVEGLDLKVGGGAGPGGGAGKAVAAAGLAVACVSTSIVLDGSRAGRGADDELRRWIDLAGELGAAYVTVHAGAVTRGYTLTQAASGLARRLDPLAAYATQRGVTVLLENTEGFRRSREVWTVVETACPPVLGVCWSALEAALAGETPAVSVPTLNSRIRCVRVDDAVIDQRQARLCAIGEGNVDLDDLFQRLLGIGYREYISVSDGPDAAQAVERVRAWITPKPPEKPAKKTEPAA